MRYHGPELLASAHDLDGFDCSDEALNDWLRRRALHIQPDPLPAMFLGQLAVDRTHQGRGLAAALLKHFLLKAPEIADLTGVRPLLVHAKNDQAANFYRNHGFGPSPVDDLTLMLLVKDIQT